VVVALAGAGAAIASVSSPVLAAFDAPGRLAYVAVAAATVLVAGGLWLELRSARLRTAPVATFAALSIVALAIVSHPAATMPSDAGRPTIAQATPLTAFGSFKQVTFGLEGCAVDEQGDVWLRVSAANSGTEPADWSQTAEIRAGGDTVATSDYARSTPLPMTLQPGMEVTGWLWLGPRERLRSADAVRFANIAADGYAAIGDVVIPTALC
jgi:hypothetical protein